MCPANSCFKSENVGVFSSFYATSEARFRYGFRELFDESVSLFDPSLKVGVWHSGFCGLSSGVLPLSRVVEALGSPLLLVLNIRVRVSILYFTFKFAL